MLYKSFQKKKKKKVQIKKFTRRHANNLKRGRKLNKKKFLLFFLSALNKMASLIRENEVNSVSEVYNKRINIANHLGLL